MGGGMDILAKVFAKMETHVTLAVKLWIALLTWNAIAENRKDARKCYTAAGSVVEERAWNMLHFEIWMICWLCGLNELEAAIL